MEEIERHPNEQPETGLPPDVEKTADDLQVEQAKETTSFAIAGFWHRVVAFSLDVFMIAIPLIILGFAFRDLAFSLGPWGRIVGFGIIFLYWGYYNSEHKAGQTIGKRVMKIAVVDSNGSYLPMSKSMPRAFVLVLIGLLNRWEVRLLLKPVLAIIATTIIFGGGLALLYGLIFNRKTRQGIHDLIVGSYVVMSPPNPDSAAPKTPLMHKPITLGLVSVGLLLGIVGLFLPGANPTFGILEPREWEEVQELQTILAQRDEFFSVQVQRLNRQQLGKPTIWKDLNIEVWAKESCSRNPEYCDQLVNEIAHIAFEQYADIDHLSGMGIAVTNRFDLGLANGHFTRQTSWSIEDWRQQLEQSFPKKAG
jgi:uncharacterized RDD family membrane protein YckC